MIGLVCPLSNAQSERGFSTLKYVLNDYRSCLSNIHIFFNINFVLKCIYIILDDDNLD